MFEVREMLRLWLLGYALRAIARMVRCDRKTVTRVVEIAKGLGLSAGDDVVRLSDKFVGKVVEVNRPGFRAHSGLSRVWWSQLT